MDVSSLTDNQLCKLCNENQRRYVCPKCSVEYCSLECYKSTNHLECSEAFYKQCVEEELQIQQCDPQMKKKTIEMLQRIYKDEADNDILNDILGNEENEIDDDDEAVDSDDEDVLSLQKRVENINFDDADALWSALTASEKQEFEALIQSGEVSKILPSWTPWWMHSLKKKHVEEINEEGENQSYKSYCPQILDTSPLESISKVSPFIKFSVINVAYAYSYTVLHFNGEHHSTPLDSIYVFLRICETIRVNRIFKDTSSAIENVLLEITNCDVLSGDHETILGTKEAGDSILNGPEDENKSFYVLSALSDLHQLMHEAKKEITIAKKAKMNGEFKSKFQSDVDLGSTEVSKKTLLLFMKKIEFYIAWLKSQGQKYCITAE